MMEGVVPPLVSTLRRLLHPPAPAPLCDLCHAPLDLTHAHIVDTVGRRLLCACPTCAAADAGPAKTRYRAVPSKVDPLSDRVISAEEWSALGVPVDLAFFFFNSALGRVVACYPGPAGASEALPSAEAWSALADAHPWVARLAPDVEALLVRRSGGQHECYRVPIAACYELVGRIRTSWTGMDGGDHVRVEIDRFFDGLVEGATP